MTKKWTRKEEKKKNAKALLRKRGDEFRLWAEESRSPRKAAPEKDSAGTGDAGGRGANRNRVMEACCTTVFTARGADEHESHR